MRVLPCRVGVVRNTYAERDTVMAYKGNYKTYFGERVAGTAWIVFADMAHMATSAFLDLGRGWGEVRKLWAAGEVGPRIMVALARDESAAYGQPASADGPAAVTLTTQIVEASPLGNDVPEPAGPAVAEA